MFPISDDIPTTRTPLVTIAILALLAYAWLFIQGAGFDATALAATVCNFGLVPGEFTHMAKLGASVPIGPGMACVVDNDPINVWTPLSSMFMHGGWAHILGNGLFLWVFGNNVEDAMSRGRFVVFFVVCGLAAAALQVAINPASPVPMVGASGAISGVLGGYLVLYPKARVNILFIIIIFIRVVPLPAYFVLVWWIGWQVISGLPQLMATDPSVSSGVAVFAHIGGFVAGVILIKPFANRLHIVRRFHRA